MALVEPLLEIAKSSHCLDLDLCRETLTGAVDEQRSLIRSVLDAKVVDELFMATMSRLPAPGEKELALKAMEKDRVEGAQNLQWALMNIVEFLYNF